MINGFETQFVVQKKNTQRDKTLWANYGGSGKRKREDTPSKPQKRNTTAKQFVSDPFWNASPPKDDSPPLYDPDQLQTWVYPSG